MILSGDQKDEIVRWRIVIIAARLMEGVPKSEKTMLLKEIERSLDKSF